MTKIKSMDITHFELYLKSQGRFSESTVYTYVRSIIKFWMSDPNIENIDDYNKFLIDHTIKKRSMHYYSAIKRFIEFIIEDRILKNTLLTSLKKPKIYHSKEKETKHFPEEIIWNVINLLEPKHRVLAVIQNITGVRVGDILMLKRPNIVPEVYEDKPVLRLNLIGKGGKRNTVYIHHDGAQRFVTDYIYYNFNFDDYYFIELGKAKNRPGNINNIFKLRKMNYEKYWHDLKKALQTVGINKNDFATHDFRRCFAREVWIKYKDIHMLQSLLNHSDPKTTMRYLEQDGLKNVDYHKKIQEEKA